MNVAELPLQTVLAALVHADHGVTQGLESVEEQVVEHRHGEFLNSEVWAFHQPIRNGSWHSRWRACTEAAACGPKRPATRRARSWALTGAAAKRARQTRPASRGTSCAHPRVRVQPGVQPLDAKRVTG